MDTRTSWLEAPDEAYSYLGEIRVLPLEVAQWAGLSPSPGNGVFLLSELNDTQAYSFISIAQQIERFL